MKTSILILIASCALAQGSLIDLTPGGFTDYTQFPFAQHLQSKQVFFDQAVHDFPGVENGWVSLYGRINGGEFFFTDLFDHEPSPFASVSWNFLSQPDHFWLTMINVLGVGENGESWNHIYLVPLRSHLLDLGSIVTVNGSANIIGISFYGRNLVPDAGTTLVLALFAYIALLIGLHIRSHS